MQNPINTTRFYFLRHGETDWNVEGRVQGHQPDIYLNATGVAQSQAAAQIFAGIPLQAILCSPLHRALQTADIINIHHQLPIQEHAGFLERNSGSWAGELWTDLMARYGTTDGSTRLSEHFPDDAETYAQMDERVFQSLEQAAQTTPQPFLIVGHGATYRALLQTLTGVSQHCQNAIPYCFEFMSETGWQATELTQQTAQEAPYNVSETAR